MRYDRYIFKLYAIINVLILTQFTQKWLTLRVRRIGLITSVKSVNIRTCFQNIVIFCWSLKIFFFFLSYEIMKCFTLQMESKGKFKVSVPSSCHGICRSDITIFCYLPLDIEQLMASVCSLSKLITSYVFIFFTNQIRSAPCSEWHWRSMGAHRRPYYLGRIGEKE